LSCRHGPTTVVGPWGALAVVTFGMSFGVAARVSSELQHTLRAPVSFGGVGIHTGRSVNVTIAPSKPNTGIVFHRTDVVGCDPRVPAQASHVCETRLGTVIANADDVRISTIEHLMAAFCGLGVDNALVSIDGPETPIMDGSSLPFVEIIDNTGLVAQRAARQRLEILRPIVVRDGDKEVSLTPAERFELAFEIHFDSAVIGGQRVDMVVDEAAFRRDLAPCRTFGFAHEVDALRAAGLARGGSMENVVVIADDRVLNPEGLRRHDEFVRHKALDAIGDLYLLGGPLLARYEARFAGHTLNNALARAVLDQPDAWRYSTQARPIARAV